ncbi:MAG: TonB-dependent receptor [Tannerellaceae bacterium]|jgi:outer membrane cobalamin receptor|nr:TonB-dependent receptor [Tannerellaceae bacterium]
MIKLLFYKRVFILGEIALTALYANGQSVDTTRWHELPGITVVEGARRSRTGEGVPVQRFEREYIERLGLHNLSEAVKQFAGTTVQDYGGIGGLKTVSVRSLGSKHTAVGYDGIYISDAQSGQVDIGRFSLENVEQVTLIIGQGDDIFQSARMYASASALLIESLEPAFLNGRQSNILLRKKAGSFGQLSSFARYEQKLSERLSMSVQGEAIKADGDYPFTLTNGSLVTHEKRENSDVRSLGEEANLYMSLPHSGKIRAKVYNYNSNRGLPGSVILYNKRTIDRLRDDNFFLQGGYEQAVGEKLALRANVKYNYAFSFYSTQSDNYVSGQQEDKNTQQEYYASAGAMYKAFRNIHISFNSDISQIYLHNNFFNSKNPERTASLSALALRFRNTRLTVTGSMLATLMKDDVQTDAPSKEMKRLSPAICLSYKPFAGNGLRIRFSYKDIFRVPTFADLYYLRLGNTRLTPEKTFQYNAGISYSAGETLFFKYILFTADTYYNKVEDKIVAYPTMYIWKMVNMGKVIIHGLDMNLTSELSAGNNCSVLLTGNYSYRKATDETDPSSKTYRHLLPYTPLHSGSGSIVFANPLINIGYVFTATGERFSLPQNTEANRMSAYSEHNISLNKTFAFKRIALGVQVEALNIGGTNYDVIRYYPMPGRSFRFGINIQY